MKQFDFSSGTSVTITDTLVLIERSDARSATKALFAGRTAGQMIIKRNAITGVIAFADYLLICALGLPTPSDFKLTNVAEIKKYPNCIVAKGSELTELYRDLEEIIG